MESWRRRGRCREDTGARGVEGEGEGYKCDKDDL